MGKDKRKRSLRKKKTFRFLNKKNKKNKKTFRRGKGIYLNECIIPAPYHDDKEKESCRQVDLEDDYVDSILNDKGLSIDKECNMYFYLQNGKYYRCRNAGKNKCNKTGKYGMKRMTCGVDSVSRIEAENRELERELQDYIKPYARYPSVPRTIPITNQKI